ncbi:unnamed protein product [Enterobius vermicularis]|uniref:Secreted protein n=1 Tax=Enterobius vermicularis TaxID=51028 RepID=A0A0N4VG26_ENTVE|nr:unnamed protein product [Enterobius vermicularis]
MNGVAVCLLPAAALLIFLAHETTAYQSFPGSPYQVSFRFRKDAGYKSQPPFKGYIDPQYSPVIRFRRNFNSLSTSDAEDRNTAVENYMKLRKVYL